MDEKLSLTELQLIIKDSLYAALPGMYWVVAEISEIKVNYAGHCYLELVEKHPDEMNIRARVRGIIWNKRYRFLKPLFENMTGESLREGQKILIRISVEYHEIYGLSLVINDIDPAFTMGEMALKRQKIIQRLEEEGVISMNKELVFPLIPKRIAVISSRTAAGYSDFIKHLAGNSSGYTFITTLFDATLQGPETESSIVAALDRISVNTALYDVVVIIRGGGSQTDLSWFDNYNIAYHVTQFPIPVVTGIGHEKDLTVTDIVAYRAEKTPTAVADFLINFFIEAEERLAGMWTEISELARSVIDSNKNNLNSKMMQIVPVARLRLSSEKERLTGMIISVINIGKEFIVREELTPVNHISRLKAASKSLTVVAEIKIKKASDDFRNLTLNSIREYDRLFETYNNSLNFLDPGNVLKRGFSITSVNGEVVKDIEQVKQDDLIDTRLYHGFIKSRVMQKKHGKLEG